MDSRFVAAALLRCFIFGVVLLFVWFVIFMAAGDWGYQFHSKLFDITRHEFELVNYCGMALLKVFILAAFLIPYLAILSTARKQKPLG